MKFYARMILLCTIATTAPAAISRAEKLPARINIQPKSISADKDVDYD